MPGANAKKSSPAILGWVCLLLGIYLMLMALEWLPVEEGSVNAPLWVLALCGIVFICAGLMILLRQHKRLVDWLAALVCFSFAAVGCWVSLYAPAEGFSGGIPFLGQENNVVLARVVFAAGAVICLLMSIYALRQALKD